MNLRTYEIIAKWIGKELGINVVFQPNVSPTTDIKTNTIYLPNNIKTENAEAALAILMHEAAHIRHTKKLPIKELIDNETEHLILNAIEDVRIDRKNFDILPNIIGFYEKLYERTMITKEQYENLSLLCRDLMQGILDNEGMVKYLFNEINEEEKIRQAETASKMWECENALNAENYSQAKEIIKELMRKYNLDSQSKPEEIPDENGENSEGGEQDKEQTRGQAKQNKKEEEKDKQGREEKGIILGGYFSTNKLWEIDPNAKVGSSEIGSLALGELTKQRFKDLLDIKEQKIIDNGLILNTDNLISFHTGDIEELFYNDKIVKRKKSKILILLDASGSMMSNLLDNQSKHSVVIKCVKSLINILEEVRQAEGIDVNWDISGFNTNPIAYNKETWADEYWPCGGTNLYLAFEGVMEKISNEFEIDGNKLIIVFTDGLVDNREIEDMQNLIIKKNSEVKCMIIGIDAELQGAFVKKIIGDNNILVGENAELVLLEVIMQLLGG
jgi:hypothetical protein